MKIHHILFSVLLSVIFLACSKDETDDPVVDPEPDPTEDCDTESMTYTDDIATIINGSCATAGCHNATANFTFPMSNYNELVTAVSFGRILGAINHEAGFTPMPFPLGSDQISECNISKITSWIEDGTPE